MNEKDVDPCVRRFFPWALFLVLAAIFAFGAIRAAHGEEEDPDPYACFGAGRYDAMSRGLGKEDCPKEKKAEAETWSGYTCENIREYLTTHTQAEARAKAVELHLPKWIIRRAEKCLP